MRCRVYQVWIARHEAFFAVRRSGGWVLVRLEKRRRWRPYRVCLPALPYRGRRFDTLQEAAHFAALEGLPVGTSRQAVCDAIAKWWGVAVDRMRWRPLPRVPLPEEEENDGGSLDSGEARAARAG